MKIIMLIILLFIVFFRICEFEVKIIEKKNEILFEYIIMYLFLLKKIIFNICNWVWFYGSVF